MKHAFLILPALIIGLYSVHAQDQYNGIVHMSISGNLAFPSSEFKRAVDNSVEGIGAGFGVNALFNPAGKLKQSPVFLGVDFTYLTFGRDKMEARASAPPYKTSFNHYGINGVARVFLTKSVEGFTPFIDGMLGLKIFNTRTKIDKTAWDTVLGDDQPEVIHTTNASGLGQALGIGFFNRRYSDYETDDGRKVGKASFSLRVLYLWGDKTSYVKRGSLQVENGYVSYEKGYTRTDMLLIQFGIYIF